MDTSLTKRPLSDEQSSDLSEKRLKSTEIGAAEDPRSEPSNGSTAIGPATGEGGSKIDQGTVDSKEKSKGKGKWSKNPRGGDGRKGKDGAAGWKRDRRSETQRSKPKEGEEGYVPPAEGEEKKERLAKRKVALLLGFCGAGYNGMQIQNDQGVKTIEGTLFEALVKAGAVSQDNSNDPTKVSLARAARTDAGVHAAGNVVSLKMIIDIPGIDDLIAHINGLLPPEIRVWDVIRTMNNFNARISCDSRMYEYLFPSYVLVPPSPSSPYHQTLQHTNLALGIPTPDLTSSNNIRDDEQAAYRATPEDLARLRNLVHEYEGTHNFHNYTIGRDFGDSSAKRFMMKIDVREPRVYGETEWISVQFHGQSFMLHQIRKMIGLVMLAARTNTPARLIPETYGPNKIHIPKAPALGLLLEQPQFGAYNTRVSSQSASSSDARQLLDYEKHREKIDQFKVDMIYDKMRKEEAESRVFDRWISFIDGYPGQDFQYLNSKGVIPPTASSKKKREDALFIEYVRGQGAGGVNADVAGKEEEEEGLDLKSAEMDG